jgi:hypothetical protein
MDFVGFPFRISKQKNHINYIKYKFSHKFGKVCKWLNMYYSNIRIITFLKITTVTTLALGSRLRQGLVKAWAKREAQESNFMLPKVLPLWELESWWTPKFSESNCRGQNLLDWKVHYIIGNFLQRRCLKWARMTHLDT